MSKQSKENTFVCRFAVGAAGKAYSGVWRVWTDKNGSIYCAPRILGGEIKASIHAPRPPEFPTWRRHYSFPLGAKSEVAKLAKADGGPHKDTWKGAPLGGGLSLEWRIRFRKLSFRTVPKEVGPEVALLPPPGDGEMLEVVVILGPKDHTNGPPREASSLTYQIAEGQLSDGRPLWILFSVTPLETVSGPFMLPPDPASSHVSSSAASLLGEFRATTVHFHPDGSLAFLDLRATKREGFAPSEVELS